MVLAQANVVEHTERFQAVGEYHFRRIVIDQAIEQQLIALRCGLGHGRHLAAIEVEK